MKNSRINRRIYELLSKAAQSGTSDPAPGQRELHFVFFRKPDSFLDSDDRKGHVAGLKLEKTTLDREFLFSPYLLPKSGCNQLLPASIACYDIIHTYCILQVSSFLCLSLSVLFFPPESGGSGRQVAVGTGEYDHIDSGYIFLK